MDFTVTRDGKNVSLRKERSFHFRQRTSSFHLENIEMLILSEDAHLRAVKCQ